MHHNDRRSVSGCQENRAKPASWGWSCRDRDAARDENGRSGFNRPRKSGIVRSNPGSSGECRIKYREDIRRGIENVPACFAEMLRGDNFGKMLVQVGVDPT
jgi:hypothetical protein